MAAPLLLTPWVNGDGIGYFAYLRSAAVDLDMDLADEFAYLSGHIEQDASGLPSLFLRSSSQRVGVDPIWHMPHPDPVTGRSPSYFSIGPAMAWAPAYLVVHGLVRASSTAGGPEKPDGYGGPYYLAIALSSFAFGVAGLVLSHRFAAIATPSREAFWSTLGIGWATPFVYYLYLSPSYAHALTALTSAMFLLYWLRTRDSSRPAVWFRRGVLAGLLFVARWNDVVLAVPVFAAAAARLLATDRDLPKSARLWRLAGCIAAALVGFLVVAAPQFAIWQYFHGRPWIRHPTDMVQLDPAAVWNVLFSARHGLFVWTPIAALAVVGLLLLSKRDRELAAVSFVALILLVFTNGLARDWWGGSAFGQRRLVSATPLLALGLSALLSAPGAASSRRPDPSAGIAVAPLRARAAQVMPPLVAILFSAWNLLLVAQFSLRMISHTEAVSLATIGTNQPRVIAHVLALLREHPR